MWTYERYKELSEQLPGLIQQIADSLERLDQLVFEQAPFARSEKESLEAYQGRLVAYFSHYHDLHKQLFNALPFEDQQELAHVFAQLDIENHELHARIFSGEYLLRQSAEQMIRILTKCINQFETLERNIEHDHMSTDLIGKLTDQSKDLMRGISKAIEQRNSSVGAKLVEQDVRMLQIVSALVHRLEHKPEPPTIKLGA